MNGDNSFSFDVYPGLDADLQAAYARNQAQGVVSPESIATEGIASAVDNALQEQRSSMIGEPEALEWADGELSSVYINSSWRRYGALLVIPPPADIRSMVEVQPSVAEKLQRFREARVGLMTTAGDTPEGQNVGETMHLTLVPWESFKANLHKLPEWINAVRGVQGKASEDDFFNSELMRQLLSDEKIYRNPIAPHFFATNNTSAPEWLSAREYLDQRIREDGPWGVILTQNSPEAGVKSMVGKSPDELTDEGRKRLEIAGYKVDGLGIFEWLALTFQQDPSELSPSDYTWMLANRLNVGGDPRVPVGDWGGDQVRSGLYDADYQSEDARPRLAVI
jgi:hypothetical protein